MNQASTRPDPILDRINAAVTAVPEDHREVVRRALILSLHPRPYDTPDGPELAADMMCALVALETADDPRPEVRAVRDALAVSLCQHGVLDDADGAA